jgi:N6-adenosine-specific RNA methylase IME4
VSSSPSLPSPTPIPIRDDPTAPPSLPALYEAAEAYGKLIEGLHIAGYTFERACANLEFLLEGDRWKVGDLFANVNAFMESLRLGRFRQVAEERKRIIERIKELQPTVSNRQIARTLGVSDQTVGRATNVAARQKTSNENNDTSSADATNVAPSEFTGERAAKLVLRKETARADHIAKVIADEQRVLALVPKPGKFRTLIIDPAWEYGGLSLTGRVQPGYATQTLEQLRALDLKQWVDEDVGCHLYCWTTNNFSNEAHKLVEHWGFQHRSMLVWKKPPPFGLGSYFRNSTEHVLFATLGETTTRPAAASIPTHFEAPRGEHSEKPEKFYDIVRAASYPPYGECNQRKARPDFVNLFEHSPSARLSGKAAS